MIIWSIFSIEFLISSSCFLNFSITFLGAFSIKLSLLSLFCILVNSECSLSFFLDNLLISDLVSIIPLRGIIIVDLDVDNKKLIERLLKRGKTSGRSDDQSEEKINKRLEEYDNKTKPLINFYKIQEKFISINGVGEFNEVTNRLISTIDSKI